MYLGLFKKKIRLRPYFRRDRPPTDKKKLPFYMSCTLSTDFQLKLTFSRLCNAPNPENFQ